MFHFGGRVAFGVNVADFFELESTFQGGRKIVQPTEVQEVIEAVILFGDGLNLLVTIESLFHRGRHLSQLVEHSFAGRVREASHSAEVDGEQTQSRDLRRKRLGRGNSDFGAGVQKNSAV